MSIQSLGVGSGLELDDLVKQLLEAESVPKNERLDAREEKIEAELSALGQIKSKLSTFQESVDELRSDTDLNGREISITDPASVGEEDSLFTAEAANSALTGSYDVVVESLASGSRIETNNAIDGGFSSSSDVVLSEGAGNGALVFKIDNTSQSFTIGVTENMTLAQLREAINSNADNFGVSANIINTGTADGGAKLVFTSSVTGSGNDLVIVNSGDLADLNRLATTDSTENASYLSPVKSASNAVAYVDGIEVQSSSNKFDNTIQNVSFEVTKESPFAADGATRQSSTLKVGFDKEGLEQKIRDFVDNYNGLIKEINTLTEYGESELQDDGALAGDSLMRGLQNGISSIISGNVSSSMLGALFQIGVELNKNGELEIGSNDFGLGSGEDRLKDALDDNFDEIAKLFSDENEGIATRLYDYLEQYTASNGLISSRESNAKDAREQVYDARERLDLRLLSYEQTLRDKYLNLDQTVARLNQTSMALLSALG